MYPRTKKGYLSIGTPRSRSYIHTYTRKTNKIYGRDKRIKLGPVRACSLYVTAANVPETELQNVSARDDGGYRVNGKLLGIRESLIARNVQPIIRPKRFGLLIGTEGRSEGWISKGG